MLNSVKLDRITGNPVAAAHGAYQQAQWKKAHEKKKQQQAGGSHYYDIPGYHHAHNGFSRRERYTTSLSSSLKSPALYDYHPPFLQGVDSHTSHPTGKPMMAAGALKVLSHHDDKPAGHAMEGVRTSAAHESDAVDYTTQQIAKHVQNEKSQFFARRGERMSIPMRLDEQRENYHAQRRGERMAHMPVQRTVMSHSLDGTKDHNPTLQEMFQHTVMARNVRRY